MTRSVSRRSSSSSSRGGGFMRHAWDLGRATAQSGVGKKLVNMAINKANGYLSDALAHRGPTKRTGTDAGHNAGSHHKMRRLNAQRHYGTRKYSRVRFRKVKFKKVGKLKKQLSGFVKDVVKCEENFGVYKRVGLGDLSSNLGGASQCYKGMWAGFNAFQANSSPFTQDACRFTPLSAKRCLDAASVLFNAKTAAYNYEGNTGSNFDAPSTKVEVAYASYKLELTNHTFVPHWITCYEVSPKENSATPFLDTLDTFVNSSTFNFSVTGASGFGVVSSSDSLPLKYIQPLNQNWSDFKGLDKLYNIKKLRRSLVKPGKSFIYKTSEKDVCVEFSKKTYASTDTVTAQGGTGGSGQIAALATYAKGEKQLIIQFEPVTHVISKTSGGNAATATTSVQIAAYNVCWTVRCDEYWKIMQPRNTAIANTGNKVKLLQAPSSTQLFGGTAPADSRISYSMGFLGNFDPADG